MHAQLAIVIILTSSNYLLANDEILVASSKILNIVIYDISWIIESGDRVIDGM